MDKQGPRFQLQSEVGPGTPCAGRESRKGNFLRDSDPAPNSRTRSVVIVERIRGRLLPGFNHPRAIRVGPSRTFWRSGLGSPLSLVGRCRRWS